VLLLLLVLMASVGCFGCWRMFEAAHNSRVSTSAAAIQHSRGWLCLFVARALHAGHTFM
jgi:hypothetical protein